MLFGSSERTPLQREADSVKGTARSIRDTTKNLLSDRNKVTFQAANAAAIGMRNQQADFSTEQQMLGQMFGQGSKIWGTQMEPVRINNDLNSSRSDPFDETSSMFGWGAQRERSGLF